MSWQRFSLADQEFSKGLILAVNKPFWAVWVCSWNHLQPCPIPVVMVTINDRLVGWGSHLHWNMTTAVSTDMVTLVVNATIGEGKDQVFTFQLCLTSGFLEQPLAECAANWRKSPTHSVAHHLRLWHNKWPHITGIRQWNPKYNIKIDWMTVLLQLPNGKQKLYCTDLMIDIKLSFSV